MSGLQRPSIISVVISVQLPPHDPSLEVDCACCPGPPALGSAVSPIADTSGASIWIRLCDRLLEGLQSDDVRKKLGTYTL